MTILHAGTDLDLLTRLREMLGSAARADIAVGYFFVSGFAQVADKISRLRKTRILVGRTDRPSLEAVASGLYQARLLQAKLDAERMVSRRQRRDFATMPLPASRRTWPPCPRRTKPRTLWSRCANWWPPASWRYGPTPGSSSAPRHTSAGTTTTPNQARPLSAPPTSPWPGSPATQN